MSEKKSTAVFLWGHVPVERAAHALLEEQGDAALKKVRLGIVAAKRARSRKQFAYWKEVEALLMAGSTAIVVDPPS